MEYQFGKYTEITDLVLNFNPSLKEQGYVRFFICADVWDFWLCRIIEGYNEEYEKEEGCYVLERNKIPMERKGETFNDRKVKRILDEEDGGNWDMETSHDIDELIKMVDGGFGILNLKTAQP